MCCVLKPKAIKHSLSFFLCRLSNEPVFEVPFCVCVCVLLSFQGFMCLSAHIFLHQCMSSCPCLCACVCECSASCDRAFICICTPALGFGVVFPSYCLLEQIEGVTLSCVDTVFSGVIRSRSILFK